jgi:GDSL-like lipase/acylhydrolase family protein
VGASRDASTDGSRRSRRRKIAYAIVVFAAAAGIAEIALRVAGYQPRVANVTTVGRRVIRWPFPEVPWVFAPGASFVQRWPSDPRGYFGASGIEYRINSAGFRGEEFARDRGDAVRVAFVGDSFCFGIGVREEDVFTSRLARALASRGPSAPRCEVDDFALPGYDTRAEVGLFERIVLPYQPDVAVVWFFLNDWERAGEREGTVSRLAAKSLLVGPRSASRLLDALVAPLDSWLGERSLIESYRRNLSNESAAYRDVLDALTRFASLCRERGIVPLLAVHPVLFRLDDSYPFVEQHLEVVADAARCGLRAVDLLPAFRGRDARALWVHPLDQHPNEIAHAIAAEAFLPIVTEAVDSVAAKRKR